jgi:hypothetical protein
MPVLSRFYGVVVAMYWREPHHRGRPHFHARYGDDEASIALEPLAVLAGSLPPRALGLVMEWAALHQEELRENWERVARGEAIAPIDPLP